MLYAGNGTSTTEVPPPIDVQLHGFVPFVVGDEFRDPPPIAEQGYLAVFDQNIGVIVGPVTDIHAVPEPASLTLFAVGLYALRRRVAARA